MSTYTQVERPIQIVTPLGEDVLLLEGFEGRESISQPFRFELNLLSEQRQIDFDAAVGMRATIKLLRENGEAQRYINGHVVSFSQGGSVQNLYRYHAVLVPWLWLLSYSGGCRIFQHKTVPEIVSQIFTERGFAKDFALRLGGTYEARDYCVQYRETDFSFVSRLLEEEGICYFFEHTEDKHRLVLADQSSKFVPCPNQPIARYHTSADDHLDEDFIAAWSTGQQVRTGKFTSRDFDFEQPRFDLLTTISGGDKRRFEQYDYPGEYSNTNLGERLARIRIEEQDVSRTAATGQGDCRAFAAGYRFKLADHYRQDMNRSYVLVSVTHTAHLPANYESNAGGGGASYENEFVCVPFTATPYRPPRTTPIPFVQGTQTATVVGPAGEEIYTDKYGRVKVQFHWDREGKSDENSSCWIRVSQPWAGGGWGAVSIPRIGQEVVVDFLEGDPDKPIIVGRVFNAMQMPPYPLPAGANMMGFKSNTTKGGGGYNEIVICDGRSGEFVRIHAQKDMETTVTGGNQTNLVKTGYQTNTVKGDMTTTVQSGDMTTTVQSGDQTNTVESGSQTNTVKGKIEITSESSEIVVTAATKITLQVGGSTITITPDNIEIKSPRIVSSAVGPNMVFGNPVDINP